MISVSSPLLSSCAPLSTLYPSLNSQNSSVPPLACGYMNLSIDSRLTAWVFQTDFP